MSTYAYMPEGDEKGNAAFIQLGIPTENIYADSKDSGKLQAGARKSGPAYRKLLKQLENGDVLYVQSLVALGFNMQEILNQWRTLTKDRGVDVVVMSSPLLDTRRGKELNGSLVADIVAEVLSYAVFDERENRRKKQREGIDRAKERGVHCGRTAKPLPENFEASYNQWKSGEISCAEAARRCHMAVSSFRDRAERFAGAGK